MTLPNQELVNYSMAPNNRGVGNNREGWHIRSNLIIGGVGIIGRGGTFAK